MPPDKVSKTEFKAKALEYLRQVEASGESLIITDKGRPAVEVRRYRGNKRSPLERLRGSVIEYKEPLEPVGLEDWEQLDDSA